MKRKTHERIIVVTWMFLGFAILSTGIFGHPDTRSKGERARAQEIEKLIRALGDNQFSIREKASKRLLEIGVGALPELRKALENNEDPEVKNRAQQIVDEIERENNIPRAVNVNGAEFIPMVDHIWAVPPAGGKTNIKLGLKITNRKKEKTRFYLANTFCIMLQDSQGKDIPTEGGGNDGTKRGISVTPPLSVGESYTVSQLNGRLLQNDRKKLRFEWEDVSGGIWFYKIPSPGKYFLIFTYEYEKDFHWDDGISLWKGKVNTYPYPIEIK